MQLRYLYLGSNRLFGTLPSSWGDIHVSHAAKTQLEIKAGIGIACVMLESALYACLVPLLDLLILIHTVAQNPKESCWYSGGAGSLR